MTEGQVHNYGIHVKTLQRASIIAEVELKRTRRNSDNSINERYSEMKNQNTENIFKNYIIELTDIFKVGSVFCPFLIPCHPLNLFVLRP